MQDAQRADGLLYVLLPVHNRRPVTEKFIASLKQQTDARFHLVLIDDGCTDGTAEMARAAGLPLTVLTGSGDWWWAGSLQQAYAWLQARTIEGNEVVLIMNDDTQFEPDFLAAGRAALAAAPHALLRAQQQAGEAVDVGVKALWNKLQFIPTRDPAEVDCFGTRGLFLRLADFIALGGFHPTLLPHYGSDYEFTMRARRRGFRLLSHVSVRLRADDTTTGDRDAQAGSLREYLRRRLSKRSARNPLYWTSFILLACPPAWILPNIARVWWDFLVQAYRAAANRPSG
jgi:GT2 family glycosyltransferase